MKFSIITATYKRPRELIRAVQSVLDQNYPDFEMIIVNDSPDFDYSEFENEELIKDSRVKYFKNKENKGVNFSRNFALDNVGTDTDYIIFLDDDDWLNTKTLYTAAKIITDKPKQNWYVSNRAYSNNISITKNNTKKTKIDYMTDYLITKKFSGDSTHCIDFNKNKKLRFPVSIGKSLDEAWYYFMQVDKKFYYYDFNSTLTDGSGDMTLFSKRNRKERLNNTYILFKDSISKKNMNPKLLIYLILRCFAITLK